MNFKCAWMSDQGNCLWYLMDMYNLCPQKCGVDNIECNELLVEQERNIKDRIRNGGAL